MAEAFCLLAQAQGCFPRRGARKLAKKRRSAQHRRGHEYTSRLNWDVVYTVAHTHIEDFAEFGREINAWVKARG